jgi:hypothetical protein
LEGLYGEDARVDVDWREGVDEEGFYQKLRRVCGGEGGGDGWIIGVEEVRGQMGK